MLYSHLEGFVKAAFRVYVSVINLEEMSCGEANPYLVDGELGANL